jgi:hypothetical protein
VLATTIFGGVGVVGCLWVVLVILAHRRDRSSLRERIMIGLMMVNAFYSSANVLPLNQLRTNTLDCGQLALSFNVIRSGRAWWFAAKYALVALEMVIIGTSVWVLRRESRAVPRVMEAAMFIACACLGGGAFAWFYVRCAEINRAGYNQRSEHDAMSSHLGHTSLSDDLDDDSSGMLTSATVRFDHGRAAYDDLIQSMLLVWDGLLGVAVLMWTALQITYRQSLGSWRSRYDEVVTAENEDDWALTRRSVWLSHRRLMTHQRDGYTEIAAPLELYVWVFVLFGVPAVVMSTRFCQDHSSSHSHANNDANSNTEVDVMFGMCDIYCELILSARTLATVRSILRPSVLAPCPSRVLAVFLYRKLR